MLHRIRPRPREARGISPGVDGGIHESSRIHHCLSHKLRVILFEIRHKVAKSTNLGIADKRNCDKQDRTLGFTGTIRVKIPPTFIELAHAIQSLGK